KEQAFFTKEINPQNEDFLPVYNSHYGSFQFEDIGFDDFPPLKDKFGTLKMTHGHQTLLFQKIDSYKSDTPLLATIEQGKRRYGFLFGENSWRWRGKSFRQKGSFEAYDEFIGKLVQYLASDKRRERLSVDFKSFYNSGEKILIRAHYFDENYQFDPRAELSAKLRNRKTGETREMPFLLKGNRYALNLSNLPPGEYKFTVQVEGHHITKDGTFTIIDFDVEKQFMRANTQKLAKIADHGLFYLDKPKELIAKLLEDPDYKPVQKSHTKTSPLIDWWYLLAIIIGSLSIEWFMRKYRGWI